MNTQNHIDNFWKHLLLIRLEILDLSKFFAILLKSKLNFYYFDENSEKSRYFWNNVNGLNTSFQIFEQHNKTQQHKHHNKLFLLMVFPGLFQTDITPPAIPNTANLKILVFL